MSLLRRRSVVYHWDGSCSPTNPGGTVQFGWHGIGSRKDEEGFGIAFSGGETATNNVSEYVSLAALMIHILGSLPKSKNIILRGDSEIAVNQFNGAWRVNHANLKPLAAVVHLMRDQLKKLGYDVKAEWVHSDKNVRADKLSRRSINEQLMDRKPLTERLGREYYK